MKAMMKDLRGVVKALEVSKRLMVCSHIEADGDSIGSQLAMTSLLEELGKSVAIVNQDPIPAKYRFLDPQEIISNRLPEGFEPDTIVILDCSHQVRLGTVKDLISDDMTLITIDHHRVVTLPGDPAYLNHRASSTGELVLEVIKELGLPIGRERAVHLYTALLSDTGGFRFPNTTAKCLAMAAELVTAGADPHFIATQIFEQRTVSSLMLLSRALSKLEILKGDRVAAVRLKQKDLEESKALSADVEGVVDHLVSIKGCLVGLLLREEPEGKVKVNLRSRGSVKVNKIAEALGGGGHLNAAGYRTRGTLLQARDQALGEIVKWF